MLSQRIATIKQSARSARRLGVGAAIASEDALALQQLAALRGNALPWTPFTMRSTAISAIVTLILTEERRNILECGSGNSTIYVSRLFAQLGQGRLTSLDHDAMWAAHTSAALQAEGLTAARVLHCPLEDGWYAVADDTLDGPYDMLVVDGPPANVPGASTARYPALPRLRGDLAPGALIVVDDANRTGEREVMNQWSAEFGVEFARQPGGIAVGRLAT